MEAFDEDIGPRPVSILTQIITLQIKVYQEDVVLEFTWEQAKALTKFALYDYAEHDKLGQLFDMDIRIRPANNNEQQENRRDRSYRIATDKVLTTGIGKRAHNYKFNHIYFEPA